MKLRNFCAICLAFYLLLLSGCQLAREDTEAEADGSRLVGALITTEHLDLFDMDRYLNDHADELLSGENHVIGDDASAYEGRLYAELVTRTLTNEETGETSEHREYRFTGIDGIAFYAPTVPATDNENSYVCSTSDEGISNGHFGVSTGEEERITLEGTILVTPQSFGKTFFVNPVFQDAQGRVYVTTGSGITQSGDMAEGARFSTKLEETTTVTDNGERRTAAASVDIAVEVINTPEQVSILQMDAESKLLLRTAYQPGTLPEELVPEPDTAYLIVETLKRGGTGESAVTRELYGIDSTSLTTYYAREDGICLEQWTTLIWESSHGHGIEALT